MKYKRDIIKLIFLLICLLNHRITSADRVKRQFGISFGSPGGRQDLFGQVIGGLNGLLNQNRPQNNGSGGGNPLNGLINNLFRPNNGQRPQNQRNDTNLLGTINLGNIPIQVTGGNGNGIGITVGQNSCGQHNCEQGCRVQRNRRRCFCNLGFILNRDRRTCSDENECARGNGGCASICQNTPGSFTCACQPPQQLQPDGRSCGFGGGNQVQSCSVNNGGCSQGCSQNNFGVSCFCQQGFTLSQDQRTCVQVDQCFNNNGGCQQTCQTTQQGRQCSCQQGYTLMPDGVSCSFSQVSQTCAVNNGGCQHFCRDFSNGRRCFCQRGFTLQSDGVSCSSGNTVQTCANNNGGCNQICSQSIFGVQCACNTGFQLGQDRKTCQAVNQCSFNNGGCQQICNNTPGSRTCSCQTGTLDANGITCSQAPSASCSNNNGGCAHNCQILNGNVFCSCRPGSTLASDGRTCNADPVSPVTLPPTRNGCGQNFKKTQNNRIVGGKPADPKDWPWMAAFLKSSGEQYCGGVLITDRHILTAAHCLKPFSASQIKVRLGEYNFDTFDDNKPTDFNVADIRIHESYNANTQENDIAIVKLQGDVAFSEFIWPICLPEPGDDHEGNFGFVTGWGTIHFGGPTSSTLQEIRIPVWNQNDCENSYPGKIYSNMMCAGLKEGGKDSCQGDSGGPLQIVNSKLRFQVAGLVSWGINCASPNRPGVYTRVNRYINWIKTNAIFP